MTITYSFNDKWHRPEGGLGIEYVFTRDEGGTIIKPFMREKLSGDNTWYVHFFRDTPAIDDAWYIACLGGRFNGWRFEDNSYFQGIQSSSHTLVWEYWNGSSWQSLPNLVDGSNGITQPGDVTWDIPNDWTAYNLIDENNHNYPGFWIRVRLTAFNNFTYGGKNYWQYNQVKPYTIWINGSGDFNIKDVYDADQSNGWGTTEMPDDYTIIFKYGFIQYYNSGTFYYKPWDNYYKDKKRVIQFGTRDEPAFWGQPLYYYSNRIIKINDPEDENYAASILNKSWDIILYSAWAPIGYGNGDYFSIGADKGSKATNINFLIKSNYSKTSNGIYNPYYSKYRWIPNNYMDFIACSFQNDRRQGCLVTEGFTTYTYCNFSDIQYFLTTNYKSKYINCYIGHSFTIDPDNEVIITDSTFGYGNENNQYYSMYTPTGDRAHYHEFIDCEWTGGNKYTISSSFRNYSTSELHLKTYFVNTLNIKVIDEQGNPIENVKIRVIDKDGYMSLYKADDGNSVYPEGSYPYFSLTDDYIPLYNVDNINVGDYLMVFGEALKVTDIVNSGSYYKVYVNRAQLNTKKTLIRRYGVYSPAINKVYPYVYTDINGESGEYKIVEYIQDRFGDINTIREYDRNPFTITIEKSGYKRYVWQGNIKNKINWEITLQKQKNLNLSNIGKISED